MLACVSNFSPVPHEAYRLGLPCTGRWDEVLNTDAADYGGSGVGNLGRCGRTTTRGTAGRRPRRSWCRRSARSGCAARTDLSPG